MSLVIQRGARCGMVVRLASDLRYLVLAEEFIFLFLAYHWRKRQSEWICALAGIGCRRFSVVRHTDSRVLQLGSVRSRYPECLVLGLGDYCHIYKSFKYCRKK